MSTSLLLRVLSVAALALAAPALRADTFAVYKVSVTLPVVHQTLNAQGKQVLATRTLKTPDIVNLALGRPLSTKLDPATEVLAFASNVTTPGAGSLLVVFNPATDSITTTVFSTSGFVLLADEDFRKNVAFAHADIQATGLGDPGLNGFQASTLAMAGTGKSSGSFATTSAAGPLSFTSTEGGVTTTLSGLVTKGKLKASGPQLALLIEDR